MHVLKYISELYSRLWDEMVFRNKVLLDCVVFHDSPTSAGARRDMLKSHEVDIEMAYVAKAYIPSDDEIRRDLGLGSLKIERVIFAADCSDMIFVDCEDQILPQFDIVALGGTFDRLHNGHRKLLSIGATVCKQTLVVGVMADNLLKSKTLSALIHSFDERKAIVINFLKEMKPDLPNVAISELNDPYGPALDPAVQAIVVSSETVGGANKINSIRKERGLSELTVIVIRRSDVATLSSTFLREKESLSLSKP
jgi:cytidyltransferase-like protein